MADENHPKLFTWAVATFHAGFTLTGLALILFLNGSLGRLLNALNTLVGFALFLILWGLTWWTTRRAIRSITGEDSGALLTRPIPLQRVLRAGFLWGGANGLLFFAFLLAALTAVLLGDVLRGFARVEFPIFFVSIGLFGTVVSFLAGSLLGSGFALLDSLLLGLVRHISPARNPVKSSLTE